MSLSDALACADIDVPELIPARMLNEFAYCPRLAYLEWVQGEFADNLETREGRFGHRRVDKPSREPVPEPAVAVDDSSSSPRHDDGNRAQSATPPNGDDQPPSAAQAVAPYVPPVVAPPDTSPVASSDTSSDASSDGAYVAQGESPATAVETIHTRSLMLSSPEEGLIAKMDLVDLSAAEAVPVDYKRGRVPDAPGGAWEPEQVQLCAQGLILRANGYHCECGILYYVESRRRVTIPFDDVLIDRTRELIRQLRAVADSAVLPPPLDDSPKCPRCSLVGICLPDETRLLAEPERPLVKGEIRRLMPQRDDALPLYIQEQGATLGKSGDVLTVKRRQETLHKVRLLDVSQVCLLGNVQVSAQALREIAAAGIPIAHFSYGGWFHALTSGLVHKNVELRMAQFAAAADARRSLRLARHFVVGKIKNCRTLLRRHLPKEAAAAPLRRLAGLMHKARAATCAASLLGIEGTAARLYFEHYADLLKSVDLFFVDGRNRRPPRDPVNALLSFVYALLAKELTIVLHAVGFDPLRGFFHQPRFGRPSLALDLAEEFRPLIGDSVVLTLVNNGEVNPSSFIRRSGAVALTDAGRRAVLGAFERRMDTLVTHPIFGYRISYRRVLEVQARLLGRVLLGEIPRYVSFCTR